MVSALASTGVTVLMTSELEDRYNDLRFSPYGTAFLTDAIIVQRYIEVDSCLRRVMAVVKVRASAHTNELRLFHIDDQGIVIGERLADHEGLLGGRPSLASCRARSGRHTRPMTTSDTGLINTRTRQAHWPGPLTGAFTWRQSGSGPPGLCARTNRLPASPPTILKVDWRRRQQGEANSRPPRPRFSTLQQQGA
jgi:hypothetical protein